MRMFPACVRCSSDQVKPIGVVPYGVSWYEDSEWYDHCKWMDGWLCSECGDEFVTEQEEEE